MLRNTGGGYAFPGATDLIGTVEDVVHLAIRHHILSRYDNGENIAQRPSGDNIDAYSVTKFKAGDP